MSSSYLAIGYECNHKCLCCPLTTCDRLHRRLSCEEVKERVRQIQPDGEQKHIVISGGEPMMHPDFLKILEFLTSEDFRVTVLSNSTQCTDRKLVSEIQKIAWHGHLEIITAVHSSWPAIHDRLTGVSGSLLETLEGLDHLVEAGIAVTIKHIFNRISLPTLTETFAYLERHFPLQVGFQFCSMDYSGRAGKNAGELYVTMAEIQPHIEEVLDDLEAGMSRRRQISFIEAPLCLTDPCYWKYFSGAPGDLNAYIAPNTEEKEVRFHVGSECGPYFEPCSRCSVQRWCPGTWVSAYRYDPKGLLEPVQKIVKEDIG